MHPVTPGKTEGTTIRPARIPSDIPVILALAEQTWEPTYRHILSPEQLNYMFEKIYQQDKIEQQIAEGQQFLLLHQSPTPVGFAAYSQLSGNNSFKLNKLYIAPAAHGYGFGRLLISAVEDAVKNAGGTLLQLNVNRQNPAKLFYEKCGYSVAYEEDIPIGPYFMNDYVMQKKLLAG